MAHELYPDKPFISTEFCLGGALKSDGKDWNDIQKYANEMIGNFNNFMAASVEWNLIVDSKGGPFHNRDGGVKGPVYVDENKKNYVLGPFYYTVGHFSKFVKRDAVRIGTSTFSDDVKATAFSNPDGEIVVIILNTSSEDVNPKIRIDNCTAEFNMPAKSLHTFIIK
jgi:glucosylceramidase